MCIASPMCSWACACVLANKTGAHWLSVGLCPLSSTYSGYLLFACVDTGKHWTLKKCSNSEINRDINLTCCFFRLLSYQHVISFPLEWQPFLAPHTARRPTQSNPSAMLWECPTSRPSGSIKYQTTGTRTMSACTPTSPPSAEPSSTWCTSSSGGQSLWSMTTAQVQVQLVSVLIFQWCLRFAWWVWQCLRPAAFTP